MIKEEIVDAVEIQVFLSGVSIFLDLSPEVIEDVADCMELFQFDKDELLITRGLEGEHMMLIKSGSVAVRLDDGDIALRKGEIIGEMSLISGHTSRADVFALEATEAFALPREHFQSLMKKHGTLAANMTRLLKSRMTSSDDIDQIGKYKILGQLGEGGMAFVYNAYDPDLGREVAIKALKYEVATTEFKKRFQQEARTIARMSHPNIMEVFEVIEDYSTNFIVMEKLYGVDLSDYMESHGSFPADRACEILLQVAKALQYANDENNGGIIHRDVKPANIFIDENDHVILTDFGIASTKDDTNVSYEGTVLYMAPELFQEKPIDHRVDIYALGITAYVMLAGRAPFRGKTIADVVRQHQQNEPAAIENFVPDIPEGLSEFVRRSLIKNPDERISDWNEIIELFESSRKANIRHELSGKIDMAIIIRIASGGEMPVELLSQLENTINEQNVDYEIETVLKESMEVDVFG